MQIQGKKNSQVKIKRLDFFFTIYACLDIYLKKTDIMKICNSCRINGIYTYNKENLHDSCNIESNEAGPSRCAIIHRTARYRKSLSLSRCLLRQYRMRDSDSLLIFLGVNTEINMKLAYGNTHWLYSKLFHLCNDPIDLSQRNP